MHKGGTCLALKARQSISIIALVHIFFMASILQLTSYACSATVLSIYIFKA